RDEHERDVAQDGAALELVADGVADLARLDGEDDERGLVRAPPLDGLVPVRDALDREPVGPELAPDLVHGRAVGFDAQKNALCHRAPLLRAGHTTRIPAILRAIPPNPSAARLRRAERTPGARDP